MKTNILNNIAITKVPRLNISKNYEETNEASMPNKIASNLLPRQKKNCCLDSSRIIEAA